MTYHIDMRISTWKDVLVDFLFPKDSEIGELENLSGTEFLERLPKCESEVGEGVEAVFDYSRKTVKDVVWEVKYFGNRVLARQLGEVLMSVIRSVIEEENVLERFGTALLIPMPISDKRRFERGWNQTELLADEILKCDGAKYLQYAPRLLAKVRHTESQVNTSGRLGRLRNLHGSMMVSRPELVREKCVVLIDDVVTTGATFHEAKRALREAGARHVLCLAVAH